MDIFPIEDLRQAVETAKRILTKEKLDKQLTGQASTSPFMSIKEGGSRRVSFDKREGLGHKIDKLTVMIGKLVTKDSNRNRPFKPQIHKSRGPPPSIQNRVYGQRNYQIRKRLSNRSNSRDRGQFIPERYRPRFEQSYRGSSFQDNPRGYSRQNSRGNIEIIIIGMVVIAEAGKGLKERYFSGNYGGDRTRSTSNSRSKSGSRAGTNRDRITCYNCRE